MPRGRVAPAPEPFENQVSEAVHQRPADGMLVARMTIEH